MRLSTRARRRLIEALTWPVTLLIVGWVLTALGYRLATLDGMSAQIYGSLSGLGDIVLLIGAIWLAGAASRLALHLWKARPLRDGRN